jgi:hypothetical protein
MELELRAYWQAAARESNGQERFKGPPPRTLSGAGVPSQGDGGTYRQVGTDGEQPRPTPRDSEWGYHSPRPVVKTAFIDFNLDPPKPRTELVTRQGNRVYVVKWTPELPRPEPTEEAEEQPSSSTEGGPHLIYTREPSPSMRPLRTSPSDTSQPGGVATGQGGIGAAVSGAGTGPATSHTPARGAGPVTVRQVLDESLAQATQQLTTALPNWATMPNGVAQLQALLQDVLTRAEAQRPEITTRPIPWTCYDCAWLSLTALSTVTRNLWL